MRKPLLVTDYYQRPIVFNNQVSQLINFVKLNIKIRYRDTWLGFFWVLLNPILLFTVQAYIFRSLFNNLSGDFLIYLATGLFPWFFLTQTAEMSCTYLKQKALLIRNLQLTPFFMIFSLSLENYINFLFSSLVVFVVLAFQFTLSLNAIVIFYVASLFFFFLVLCLSFFLSYAHTLFRDVKYIIQFIFTLLYFLTPTFYYLNSVSAATQVIIKLNPMFWILKIFRLGLKLQSDESVGQSLIVFLLILFTTLIFTFWSTKKLHNRFYLRL